MTRTDELTLLYKFQKKTFSELERELRRRELKGMWKFQEISYITSGLTNFENVIFY